MHAGFVFGIGLIGLIVLVRTVEDSLAARKLTISWKLWGIVAACLLAWMINPHGWRLLGYPWEYLRGDTIFQGIIEWQPPPFGLNPRFFEGSFWWLAILVVLGAYCHNSKIPAWAMAICLAVITLLSMRDETASWGFVVLLFLGLAFGDRRQVFLIALCAVTLAMACKSRRFIPLFAVTSAPLAALALLYLRDKLSGRWPVFDTVGARVGAALVGLLIAVGMWSQTRISSSLLRDWAMADVYPEDEVAWLKETFPDERVLNYYNWGGFILLHSPDSKIFIDGRANTLYDEVIYQDYLDFLRGRVDANRLARYASDLALIPPGPFDAALQKLATPWSLFHQGTGVILLPPHSPLRRSDLPTVEDIVPDGIQAHLSRSNQQWRSQQSEEAVKLLRDAVEKYPYATQLYGSLAKTHAMLHQYDKVAEVIDLGVKRNPRRRTTFRQVEANIYLQAGQLERALPALREAVPEGPFAHREQSQNRVKKIEEEIARRKRGFGA
jgi:tetratricopeptide (TPR) repeat protein